MEFRLLLYRGRSFFSRDDVADVGDAQDAHSTMTSDGHLGRRRHPNGVRAYQPQEADLGRGLEGGTGDEGVDTFAEGESQSPGNAMRQLSQLGIISLGHIGEARAQSRIVGAVQGIVTGHTWQAEVISDEHEITRLEAGVEAAGCVCDDEDSGAQGTQDPHRERDLLHRVALVEMDSPVHHSDGSSRQAGNNQLARMPLH